MLKPDWGVLPSYEAEAASGRAVKPTSSAASGRVLFFMVKIPWKTRNASGQRIAAGGGTVGLGPNMAIASCATWVTAPTGRHECRSLGPMTLPRAPNPNDN